MMLKRGKKIFRKELKLEKILRAFSAIAEAHGLWHRKHGLLDRHVIGAGDSGAGDTDLDNIGGNVAAVLKADCNWRGL
jgi:hypothetical protein